MPRGNPKSITTIRLDPALIAAVHALHPNLTAAIEAALRLWLIRERRRAGQEAKKGPPKPPERRL